MSVFTRRSAPAGNRGKRTRSVAAGLLLMTAAGCGDDAGTGPLPPAPAELVFLNSTGQTLGFASIGEGVEVSQGAVDLGAGFDGAAFDLSAVHAVTSVSAFGGSRILFVDLEGRTVSTTRFPEPESDLANPSAPGFDPTGDVWVGGRASDAVYRLRPGDEIAERVAQAVGTFVERVVPVGDRIYAVDANIDDDGGTYAPLGPGRIVAMSRAGQIEEVIELPEAALNPTDAVAVGDRLIVLVGGTFDPATFAPQGNGALATVDLRTGQPPGFVPLAGNGVAIELGADGLVYVTSTTDFETLNLLRFDPGTLEFDRGPENPIVVRGADAGRVDCWAATGLADGRIACVTFSFAEAGRLVLTDAGGAFISEAPAGFGTTDLALR